MKLNDENLEREEIKRATTRQTRTAGDGETIRIRVPDGGKQKESSLQSSRWRERKHPMERKHLKQSIWGESACMLGKKAADGKKAYVFIRST